jgi:hypothetical protein
LEALLFAETLQGTLSPNANPGKGSVGGLHNWMSQATARIQRAAQTHSHLSSTRSVIPNGSGLCKGGIKKVTVCGSAAVPAAVPRATNPPGSLPADPTPALVAEGDRSWSIPDFPPSPAHRYSLADTDSRPRSQLVLGAGAPLYTMQSAAVCTVECSRETHLLADSCGSLPWGMPLSAPSRRVCSLRGTCRNSIIPLMWRPMAVGMLAATCCSVALLIHW